MTTRTRYFVIVSLLVLGVGLGTGLVAYYVGFPAGALGRQGGPTSSRSSPATPPAIAFANVHDIMTSELRQKVRRVLPMQENGQRELENQTGINIETDIDRVVACLYPDRRQHDQGRRHGPRARPLRRSENRSADARARRARRDLQRQAARRRRPRIASTAGTTARMRTRPTPASRRGAPPTASPCRSWSPASSPSAARPSSGPPSTCITPATIRRRASKASPATKS